MDDKLSDQNAPFNNPLKQNSESVYEWHNDRSNYCEQKIGEMPTWIKKHEGIN